VKGESDAAPEGEVRLPAYGWWEELRRLENVLTVRAFESPWLFKREFCGGDVEEFRGRCVCVFLVMLTREEEERKKRGLLGK